MPVSLELANEMCFFYAEHTPMLSAVKSATISFIEKHPDLPRDNVTDVIATLIAIILAMIDNRLVRQSDINHFCYHIPFHILTAPSRFNFFTLKLAPVY